MYFENKLLGFVILNFSQMLFDFKSIGVDAIITSSEDNDRMTVFNIDKW